MPFYSTPKGNSPVLSGAGAPAANLGNVGDIYINTSNGTLYGPKTALGWGSGASLQGPAGPTGPQGPAGSQTTNASLLTSGTLPDARLSANVVLLDGSGKVPTSSLPSYVDDVVEYANLAAFPGTGESGKIYVAVDSRKVYRWSGSAYIEVSPSEVTSVAGKTGAVTLSPSDCGAAAASHSHSQSDIDSSLGGSILSDDISYLNINKADASHASQHFTGGSDALAPSDIGAADASHSHGSLQADGTLSGLSIGAPLIVASDYTITQGSFGDSAGTFCQGNDARLSDSRSPTAHTHAAGDIASGTVATARLASGTASSTTFLRGDSTWSAAPVTSVAGKTGAVTLTASDVSAAPSASPTFTGVVTVPAGSVTAPGVSFSSYAGTGVSSPAANVFAISTNGSERLRVQADGKIAIGATSASDTLDVTGTAAFRGNGTVLKVIGGSTASATTNFQTDAFGGLVIDGGGSRVSVSSNGGNALLRGFNSSVILDHGYDNGATSHIRFSPGASEAARCIASSANGSLGPALLVGYTSTQSTSTLYRLQVNSQIFATSSTIATSDGRYKENVSDLVGALGIVNQLRPVEFSWKPHPVHRFPEGRTVGFIAQEVQQALAGTAYVANVVKANHSTVAVENDDGTVTQDAGEEFLGIAEGNLIAILCAAVKELAAKVAALEAAGGQ